MASNISPPKLGTLTQGTIFTCADAEDYSGCKVHGLVITARCDVAQKKADVFNYLPVVTLDDWVHRDGRILLCDRVLKDTLGRMRRSLKSANYSESIMLTQSPENILSTLFPENIGDKADQKARASFLDLVTDYQHVVMAHESEPSKCLAREIGNKHSGQRDSLLRELINQRLTGYYFLPSIFTSGSEEGHVVLLREVRHIPRELAGRVGDGISAEEYATACSEQPRYSGRLCFESEPFGMPVSQLQSPHVEHLMQVFSILFSRIGLPDPDQSFVDGIWNRLPSIGETK